LAATGGWQNDVYLWEVASGRVRHRFVGHQNPAYGLAFSPDGKLLAAASSEAPVFVWDVEGRHGRPPSAEPFSDEERTALWDGLAHSDASVAFAAVRQLLARPGPGVALLREQVGRTAVDDREAARLVRDLGDDDFRTRERASARLTAAGRAV